MTETDLLQLRFNDRDAEQAIAEIRQWGAEQRRALAEWSASRAELGRIPWRPTCPPGRVSAYLRALQRHNDQGGPKPELTWDGAVGALILTYPNATTSTEETAA